MAAAVTGATLTGATLTGAASTGLAAFTSSAPLSDELPSTGEITNWFAMPGPVSGAKRSAAPTAFSRRSLPRCNSVTANHTPMLTKIRTSTAQTTRPPDPVVASGGNAVAALAAPSLGRFKGTSRANVSRVGHAAKIGFASIRNWRQILPAKARLKVKSPTPLRAPASSASILRAGIFRIAARGSISMPCASRASCSRIQPGLSTGAGSVFISDG